MAFLEGTAQSAGFIVISQSPDVCKSPAAPIPYNIVGFLDKSILTSTDVRFQGFWVFDTMSRVATVIGNEAGIGGGVASQTNLGMCKPVVGPSTTVLCNGNQVCRHETAIYEMNLLGPEGSSNTLGKVYYLGAMMCGPVGPKGAMPSGANAVIPAKSPGELGALDKIKNSLSIDSIEDAVSMSQRAYDLSQVDWENPAAALGALGGMAGRAGLGDLAAGINAVNKGMNTDWDDPASVLAAAGAMAGPLMKAGKAAGDYLGSEEPINFRNSGESTEHPPVSAEAPPLQTLEQPKSLDPNNPVSNISSPDSTTSTSKTDSRFGADNSVARESWRDDLAEQMEDHKNQITWLNPTEKVLADGKVSESEHLNRNVFNYCPDKIPSGVSEGIEWKEKSGLANLYHSPLECATGKPVDASLGPGSFECCYEPTTGALVPNAAESGTYNYYGSTGFNTPFGPIGKHGEHDVAPHDKNPNYPHVNMTLNREIPKPSNSPWFGDRTVYHPAQNPRPAQR